MNVIDVTNSVSQIAGKTSDSSHEGIEPSLASVATCRRHTKKKPSERDAVAFSMRHILASVGLMVATAVVVMRAIKLYR